MTDKQIIIDDLIKQLNEKTVVIMLLRETLDRKEQECEKIKNWVKGMMFYTDCTNWFERFTTAFEDWKNDLTSQLDQLKAENEKLKKQVCGLRPELKFIIDKTCCKYNTNAKYYHEKIVEIINNLDQLKQALTEIKEIAKWHTTSADSEDIQEDMKQILQKISECEVDNA